MSFGQTLRTAREAKGLTTSELAARTHLLVQIVEGLENEDFRRIPAPIYGRGFVKLYCEVVGIDPKPLQAEFMALYTHKKDAPAKTPQPPPPSAPQEAPPPRTAVLDEAPSPKPPPTIAAASQPNAVPTPAIAAASQPNAIPTPAIAAASQPNAAPTPTIAATSQPDEPTTTIAVASQPDEPTTTIAQNADLFSQQPSSPVEESIQPASASLPTTEEIDAPFSMSPSPEEAHQSVSKSQSPLVTEPNQTEHEPPPRRSYGELFEQTYAQEETEKPSAAEKFRDTMSNVSHGVFANVKRLPPNTGRLVMVSLAAIILLVLIAWGIVALYQATTPSDNPPEQPQSTARLQTTPEVIPPKATSPTKSGSATSPTKPGSATSPTKPGSATSPTKRATASGGGKSVPTKREALTTSGIQIPSLYID